MSNRPIAERARYDFAHELSTRSLNVWQVARLIAFVSVAAFIVLEPEHRLARALLKAAIAFFTLITQSH